MALCINPARLRDELTDLWLSVSAGDHLLAAGVHQPPVLIRPTHGGDRGRQISLTQFRRQLHRILREASQEPIIVTVLGDPTLWVGRDPASRRSTDRPLPRSGRTKPR